MGAELNFFCTTKDILLCMREVERAERLRYYPDSSTTSCPKVAVSADEIISDITTEHGARFLVTRSHVFACPRKIEPSIGEPWYAFDLMGTPDGVMVAWGGQKKMALLPGSISALKKTTESASLFKSMSEKFKKGCRRIKSYWVGPEALVLLRSGHRLTSSETSSGLYDLRED